MTSVYLFNVPDAEFKHHRKSKNQIYGVVAGSKREAEHLLQENAKFVGTSTPLSFVGKLDEIKDEVEDAEDQVARVHPWSEEP